VAEYEAVSTTAVSADPAVVVPLLTINGWILMQRKITGGLVSFNKTWAQYRDGFGSATDNDNYWLGLDKVYRLVQLGSIRLRVEVVRVIYICFCVTTFWLFPLSFFFRAVSSIV